MRLKRWPITRPPGRRRFGPWAGLPPALALKGGAGGSSSLPGVGRGLSCALCCGHRLWSAFALRVCVAGIRDRSTAPTSKSGLFWWWGRPCIELRPRPCIELRPSTFQQAGVQELTLCAPLIWSRLVWGWRTGAPEKVAYHAPPRETKVRPLGRASASTCFERRCGWL